MQTKSPSAAERWLNLVDPHHRTWHVYDGCRWEWEGDGWVNVTARRMAQAEAAEKHDAMQTAHVLTDGKRAERIYDATPSWDDLKAEIPGLNVIEHPDGSKSADFRDTTLDLRQKKRLGEMFGEARELEIEKSEDVSSRVETVTVGKGRRKKKVPVFSAEKADREARAS